MSGDQQVNGATDRQSSPPAGQGVDPALTVLGEPARSLRAIGGLVAIGIGLFVLLVITIVGMVLVRSSATSVVAVVSGAVGVIGSVIGAYFGVKVGSEGRQAESAAKDAQAKTAQAFALHVPEDRAQDALAAVQGMTTGRMPDLGGAPAPRPAQPAPATGGGAAPEQTGPAPAG